MVFDMLAVSKRAIAIYATIPNLKSQNMAPHFNLHFADTSEAKPPHLLTSSTSSFLGFQCNLSDHLSTGFLGGTLIC